MKRIGLLFLALAVGVGLLIVTASPRERGAVDLLRPSTLLSFVANRLHAVQPYVNKQIDAFTAAFRETVGKHENPKKSLGR
jgi:hypothetical protein